MPKARKEMKKIQEEKEECKRKDKLAALLEKMRKGELTKEDLEEYERRQ